MDKDTWKKISILGIGILTEIACTAEHQKGEHASPNLLCLLCWSARIAAAFSQ